MVQMSKQRGAESRTTGQTLSKTARNDKAKAGGQRGLRGTEAKCKSTAGRDYTRRVL